MATTTGLIDTSQETAPTTHRWSYAHRAERIGGTANPGAADTSEEAGRNSTHNVSQYAPDQSLESHFWERRFIDTTTLKAYPKSRPRTSVQQRQPPQSVCLCLSVHKIPRSVHVALNPSRLSRGRAISQHSRQTHGQSQCLDRGGEGLARVFLFFCVVSDILDVDSTQKHKLFSNY